MTNLISRAVHYLRLPAVALVCLPFGIAQADSGFYVGGSVGNAGVELDADDVEFDEDDFAWKAYGGFNFDIIVVDLAVEAGYVNFGSPGTTIQGLDVGVEVDAFTGFGLVGLELGPIGVFGKAGLISWDGEQTIEGLGSDDDSGTDPAYGIGARFSLWSLEFRAEYEVFDIDVDGADSSDLSMISAGVVWTF
jgi:hypothetical protein